MTEKLKRSKIRYKKYHKEEEDAKSGFNITLEFKRVCLK